MNIDRKVAKYAQKVSEWKQESYFYLVKDLDQHLNWYTAYMKYKGNFSKCVLSFYRF